MALQQVIIAQIGVTHWLAVGAGAAIGAWARWGLSIASCIQNAIRY